jgi:hypothetical protein
MRVGNSGQSPARSYVQSKLNPETGAGSAKPPGPIKESKQPGQTAPVDDFRQLETRLLPYMDQASAFRFAAKSAENQERQQIGATDRVGEHRGERAVDKSSSSASLTRAVTDHNSNSQTGQKLEIGRNGALVLLEEPPRVQPDHSPIAGALSRVSQAAKVQMQQPTKASPDSSNVMRATKPSARDSSETAHLKSEYRQAYLKADEEYGEALATVRRAVQGEGNRDLPGGGKETIKRSDDGTAIIATTLPDGSKKTAKISRDENDNTIVSTSDSSGKSKLVKFDPKVPGKVYVREQKADTVDSKGERVPGKTDTWYRYGGKVRVGPSEEETYNGLGPSVTYSLTDSGKPRSLEFQYGEKPGVSIERTITTAAEDGMAEIKKYPMEIDRGKLRQAKNNFEIDIIRERINSQLRDPQGRAITGAGQKIGLLDDGNEFTGENGSHSAGTTSVVNHHEFGVATGATTQLFAFVKNGSYYNKTSRFGHFPNLNTLLAPPVGRNPEGSTLEDNLDSLNSFLKKSGSFTVINDRLEGILKDVQSGKTELSVLNMSIGAVAGSPDMGNVMRVLNAKEDGRFAFPSLRKSFLGTEADTLTTRRQMETIGNYVNKQHNEADSVFTKSMKRYRDITKKLADAGVCVVVAAGNGNGEAWPDEPERPAWGDVVPGSTLNALCKSEHVIAVGGSNSNGTKGDYTDDTVARYGPDGEFRVSSPRGEGEGGFNPTLLAPAENLTYLGVAPGHGNGSSQAAPFVSGVIALMRQANPKLTPAQVKDLLSRSAVNIADLSGGKISRDVAGAGVVDPERAVRLAMQE